MHDVFTNLLISCPNNGGLFLHHQGSTYKLDGLDTTGFMVHGSQMLRALQPARLVQYGDTQRGGVTSGADFDDIHDVLIEGEFRYVVKTDSNEIIKLDKQGQEKQRWTLPGERDSWHVNCLTRWNKRLVFSAFGDLRLHKEYKKKSRDRGFVQDLDTGEKLITGLSQPHSLVVAGDKLLLANSENFEIREYDGSGNLLRSKEFDGYTRGIFLHESVLYVGLSRSRNVDLGPIAYAVVVALDGESWEELDRAPLPTNEIFSIQRVDDAAMLTVLAMLASHASHFLGEQVKEYERDGVRLVEEIKAAERRAEQLRLEATAKDELICKKDALLRGHDDTNRESERKIYGLLETIHGKDIHIQTREEVIRAKDLEIQRRDEVIQSNAKELGIRDEVIRGKDAEVRFRDEMIQRLERQMVECRLDLRAQDKIVFEMESKINDQENKDEIIVRCENAIQRSENRIAALTEEARLRAEDIERLREEVDVKSQQINDMSREADASYSKVQTLKNELQVSQARVADIESSRSWRITRPIRAVKMALTALSARRANYDRAANDLQNVVMPEGQQVSNTLSASVADAARALPMGTSEKNLGSGLGLIRSKFDLRGSPSPVVILTTQHCIYVAEEIAAALRQVGIRSQIIHKMPETGYDEVPHFVICPQMFEKLPGLYVSFQMEQSVSSRWFTKEYVQQLEKSFAIFDYSLVNIAKLQNMGLYAQQMYHVPIGYLGSYGSVSKNASAEYDVIFYGDIQNSRRRKFIAELSKVYKVKVINDLFGESLQEELARARVVVNIHYYAGALLETTRLWECLSLGKLIVSERAVDMDQHDDLLDLVDFVDVDDIAGMVERVSYWLSNEEHRRQRLNRNEEMLRTLPNQFDARFYRFLLATDNITFDEFWTVVGQKMTLPGDKICLNLPEFVRRSQSFDRDNHFGFKRFTGLRHSLGWVGCAMSYKLMIMLARQQGLQSVVICEDDVEFPRDFESRWSIIQKHLLATPKDWDVFSGLMADLHEDARILRTYTHEGIQFAVTDKLISMVFNVYSSSTYDAIASWDDTNREAATNTIDRYLERSRSIKIVTTLPFLVGHKEELHSTLWGFQNTQYANLIAASSTLLKNKLDEYGGRDRGRLTH